MERDGYQYDIFISYRHKPLDGAVASGAIQWLESYKLPDRQQRQGLSGVRRVFRDTEELSVSGTLSDTIAEALNSARNLIVICSPDTPASEWVDKEVSTFIELGRENHIYALLIEGNKDISFPPSLKKVADISSRTLDAREGDKRHILIEMRQALIPVIARCAGCTEADLRRSDRLRAMAQTTLRYAGGACLFALVLAVSLMLWQTADRYRAAAAAEQSAAMSLIGSLTYDLPAALSGLPGTYGPISGMLSYNVVKINEILEVSSDIHTVNREKAANLEKLARVHAIMGDSMEAATSSSQAVELYKALYEETGTKESLSDYASGLNNFANRLGEQGDFVKAGALLETAIALQEKIASDSADYKADLGRYYHNIAVNNINTGDFRQAALQAEQSLDIIEELAASGEPFLESDIIAICRTLGSCYGRLAEYGEADLALQKALSIAQAQIQESGTRANHRILAAAYSSLASNYSLWGNPDETSYYYRLAIEQYEMLAEDTDNKEALRSLGNAYMNLGVSLNTFGSYNKAHYYYNLALVIYGELAKDGNPLAQAQYAGVYYAMAENALDAAAYKKARTWYEKCLALYEPVAESLGNRYHAEYLAKRSYYKIVFAKDRAGALEDSTEAMGMLPSTLVRIIHAYALMYNNEYDSCIMLAAEVAAQGENERQNIREDFAVLRAMGFDHPYMKDIEALMG